MNKYLILSDLDLTLINGKYRPTVPLKRIRTAVQRCIDRGSILGIISDSSQVTLERWVRQFQLNGPIIGEKGAFIAFPNKEKIVTHDERVNWPNLKQDVIEALRVGLGSTILVIEDNFLRILEEGIHKPKNKRGVVVVNNSRQHSMSFHVRLFDHGGKVMMNGALFEEAVDITRQTLLDKGLDSLNFAPNKLYEIVIIADPNVHKGIAMDPLLKHYLGYQLVVLGNDSGELPLRPFTTMLCAVQNATPELKAVADYVATKPYTAGVLEILEHIHRKKE